MSKHKEKQPQLNTEETITDRIFMAQLSEQGQDYETMLEYLKEAIKLKLSDFTIQERNLLSVAFKNSIITERKAIKLVVDVAAQDKFSKYEPTMKAYRKRLEKGLQ